MQQPANFFQHALAHCRTVELYGGCGHNTHEELLARLSPSPCSGGSMPPFLYAWDPLASPKLQPRTVENPLYALFFVAWAAEKPFGNSVVERSTPERSAPVKSVSRRIATPMSAPENFAPFTLARRRFTFRRCARWKFTFERSQRKNSTPLACASVKSAPGRIASVMSVLRKSDFRRLAPDRSAPGSFALRRSVPSRFALRRIAPLKFAPLKSALERSALVRSARPPPSFPLKKRSCASRICTSDFPLCLMPFGFRSPIVVRRRYFSPCSLPEVTHGGNHARSILRGNRGRRRRRRSLRPQRVDYRLRDVLAPARIVIDGLNCVNRPPRNAPPARHQREQRERQALHQRVFTLSNKINIRRTPERQNNHGNAVLKNNELRSALEFELQLAMLHPFDALNFRCHSCTSSIATVSNVHSQVRFAVRLRNRSSVPVSRV